MPGFTYSACGPFPKKKWRKQKIKKKKTNTKYIYRNKLDKVCFQQDIACGYFKDLASRKASDKVMTNKELNIAKKPKCHGY